MRRVMLLALLALALPTAEFAQTIPFTFSTGLATDFATGTVMASPTNDPTALDASVTGTNGITVDFSTNNLSCSSGGLGLCTFTMSSVTVKNSGGTILLSDSLMPGSDIRSFDPSDGMNNDVILADLAIGPGTLFGDPNSMINSGDLSMAVVYTNDNTVGNASTGSGVAMGTGIVPEPGTLGLLGTGLISLGGMAIRKLKLGR